jgi:hypothetical protein
MLGRQRNFIGVLLIISVALATLIVLDPFAPSPSVVDPPAPTAGPAATSMPTAQLAGSTETAPATQAPTHVVIPPTPTSVPLLPARPAQGSKLGVHGIWSGRVPAFARTLAEAGAPFRVVKAVDDLGWLKDVRRVSPATVTVARLTHEHEAAALVNDPGTDLDGYAVLLMAPILGALEGDPALKEAVDYWELTNEPLGGGVPAETYARLARLTINAMDVAEANGLKLAIFGFNAGTPEWADLLALVETGVFARAKSGGHILALHEGVFGDDPIDKWWNAHFVDTDGNATTQNTGVTAPSGWIPGGPVIEGAGALCLRFRFLYHLLVERDEVVPLFVSEFYAGGGYDPARKADVVARVAWYDAQLAAYDYVLGFAPFTLGPTPGWAHQDYTPFYEGPDGLVAYMMAR